jgi:putative phosphonoacetaldehyde dehydrogenase
VSALSAPAYDFPCLVGGEEVRGEASFAVHFPYAGEQIGRAPLLDRGQVDRALSLAGSCRIQLDRHGRAQVLERIAERIAREGEELAQLITWESGLSLRDTEHEVRRAIDVFRFAAMEALRDDGAVFACDTSANGRPRRAYTVREPVRLVAAITPFNHPLNQVAHKVAPAIAAAAPMVVKPSEKTPLAGLWLGQAILDAGWPADALAVITGDRAEILDAMLAHPAVEVVSFTGSVAVGHEIARRLGYRRAVLELGGNDPLIVLRDADLDGAAALAVAGATRNSGQRCTSVKRVIVEAKVADELAERIEALTDELVVGDPFDESTDVGTLIDEDAATLVERRVTAASADGARLRRGGARVGALLDPPVVDHVPPATELVREETFGPAIPIIRVADLDEALAVANGTAFGLSAGVVSNDLNAITRCVRELRCGTVNVNEVPGYRTELTPFGGVKDSGLGVKEGVVEAMRAMTTTKLFTLPWP